MPLAVCATPIGNLDDVTLRVLDELRAADIVLCEDTRHTRILLERHGIAARLLSYHEHNEAARIAELLPRLEAGERIALVSDAGLPGISDPGATLVRAALDAGLPVTVLPGPVGRRDRARRERARGRAVRVRRLPAAAGRRARGALGGARAWEWPVVAFESPQRLPAHRCARWRRSLPERRGRGVPRADEAVRGGRRGVRRRARRALRRAAEGRDHARRRGRRGWRGRGAPSLGRSLRWPSSWRPGRRGGLAAEVVSRLTGVSRNDLYRGSL